MDSILGTMDKMLGADYWVEKLDNPNEIIMTKEEIDEFNKKQIEKTLGMTDIFAHRDSLSKEELRELIKHYKVPTETRYNIDGDEVTSEVYEGIISNTNYEGILENNRVLYGITVRDTDIRSFPTDMYVFKTIEDKEFDRFQETRCQAFEGVLILHESLDKKWFFIKCSNYIGWAKKEDIALGEKDEILEYISYPRYMIVTGNYVQTQYNPFEERVSRLRLQMGTKLSIIDGIEIVDNQSVLNNYSVKIPVRNCDGGLEFKTAIISKEEDVNEGYLPYTRENILRQIFKLLGDRYGWGDRFGGRDCSSTIMYVYKTFGFKLPRNADVQEKGYGRLVEFKPGDTIEEREKLFDDVKPGAAIYMPGHVMMYIGKKGNTPYMIHNFHGYGRKVEGEYKFIPVNQVFVTSTQMTNAQGKKYIEEFTSLLQFEG